MQMDAGLDTGPVVLSEAMPIAPEDTAGALERKLADLGARLIVAALADLDPGNMADLEIVGHGAHGTLFRFQHVDFHHGAIRQKRTAPASRSEGADGRHGQKWSLERKDRAVRRKIIGR